MCLVSKKGTPIKCRVNLKCYKVFRVEYGLEREQDRFYGAFTKKELPKYGVITDYVYSAEGNKKLYTDSYWGGYVIDDGYIHTFRNLEDAKRGFTYHYFNSPGAYVIYECIIPKGTEYFRGRTGYLHAFEGFASKKIKIGKQIGETTCV